MEKRRFKLQKLKPAPFQPSLRPLRRPVSKKRKKINNIVEIAQKALYQPLELMQQS